MHPSLIPPTKNEVKIDRDNCEWITEYDINKSLTELGHETVYLGLENSLERMINKINSFKPDLIFNLLEEFDSDTQSDYKPIAALDMLQIKYTGCNPKGLLLARDKALSKKILKYHKIGTPSFYTFPQNKKRKIPKNLKFPLIVKCLFEEASFGIAKASICSSPEKVYERLDYIKTKLNQDAIVEEFIEGRELYVGIMGNDKLTTFPIWELHFENVEEPEKEIYSSQAKWNENYRSRKGIKTGPAILEKETTNKIIKTCKKVYSILQLSGYARIDLRLTSDNKIYILEANPNPNIASDDDFASSALHDGLSYNELIKKIIS